MKTWFQIQVIRALLQHRKRAIARVWLTTFVGALWIIAGVLWYTGSMRSIATEARSVKVDFFLNPLVSDQEAHTISSTVAAMPSVRQAWMVHEAEMWKELNQALQGSAEELADVVRLPRLIRVLPWPDAVTERDITTLVTRLRAANEDSITEVAYPRQLVQQLDARRTDLQLMGGAAAIVSLLLFAIGFAYAFRSELNSAAHDLRAGAMMGTGKFALVAPYLAVHLTTGMAGLATGAAVIHAVLTLATGRVTWLTPVAWADLWMSCAVLAVIVTALTLWQALQAGTRAYKKRRPR